MEEASLLSHYLEEKTEAQRGCGLGEELEPRFQSKKNLTPETPL